MADSDSKTCSGPCPFRPCQSLTTFAHLRHIEALKPRKRGIFKAARPTEEEPNEDAPILDLPAKYKPTGRGGTPRRRRPIRRARRRTASRVERVVCDPLLGDVHLRKGDDIVFTHTTGTQTLSEREQIIERSRITREMKGGLADYVFDIGKSIFGPIGRAADSHSIDRAESATTMTGPEFPPMSFQAAPIGLVEASAASAQLTQGTTMKVDEPAMIPSLLNLQLRPPQPTRTIPRPSSSSGIPSLMGLSVPRPASLGLLPPSTAPPTTTASTLASQHSASRRSRRRVARRGEGGAEEGARRPRLPRIRESVGGLPRRMTGCWNCRRPGHGYRDCRYACTKKFCFRCDTPGTDVHSCTKCPERISLRLAGAGTTQRSPSRVQDPRIPIAAINSTPTTSDARVVVAPVGRVPPAPTSVVAVSGTTNQPFVIATSRATISLGGLPGITG